MKTLAGGARRKRVKRLALLVSFFSFHCSAVHGQIVQPPSEDDVYQRGKAALDRKDFAEAERELGEAESRAPGQTNALALRAKALIHLARFREAEQCLRAYLGTHENSPDTTYLLAYVLFREDQPRESLAMYTEAAKLQRPSADDFKIIGLDYALLNDNPDTIRWLKRSLAEDPNNAETAYYLGRAYYVQNSFDEAIAAFQRALALNPQYAKAQDNLGLAYEGRNELQAAESAYRKAIEIGERTNVRSEQPYINLADLLSHAERNDEALPLLDTAEQIAGKSAKAAELRGRIFFAKDEPAKAEVALRTAITLQPQNGALHYLLGRVLTREGKKNEAEQEFSKTRALIGNSENAAAGSHVDLARRYMVDRPLDALTELQEALKTDPGRADAQSLVREIAKSGALNALRAGDKDKALAIVTRARTLLPDDPEILYVLGMVALECGLNTDAEAALQRSVQIRPDYDEARYALARAYLAESKAALAEQEMRNYLAKRPSDATAQYGLGYILVAEQRLDEAKSAFEKSLELQPNQTESMYQLGDIALQQKQTDIAREHFAQVLARDPHHAGALTDMGIMELRSAHFEPARTYLQQAIASAPSYQKAHYYYALTLAKSGRKTEADREFEISRNLEKQHTTDVRLATQ